jgi:hypothetical protein
MDAEPRQSPPARHSRQGHQANKARLEQILAQNVDGDGRVSLKNSILAQNLDVSVGTIKRLLAELRSEGKLDTDTWRRNLGDGRWLNRRTIAYVPGGKSSTETVIRLEPGFRAEVLRRASEQYHHQHGLSVYDAGKAADRWFETIPISVLEKLPAGPTHVRAIHVLANHPLIIQ